jgi:FkbM family methyltransferase
MTERDDYLGRGKLTLCELIWQRQLLQAPLVVLDIGARDAFAEWRWTALPAGMIALHGFEPDEEECRRLNEHARSAGLNFAFHPAVLASRTGEAEFYEYSAPAANSLYPGNPRLLERWCYTRQLTLASQFRLHRKSVVRTSSLADWAASAGVDDVDFCKLNVQGAELDVLSGGATLLQGAMGLILEQTFNETYLGAPLFGEVYEFVRRAGFTMFDIIGMNLVGRTRSPVHLTEDQIPTRQGTWPHHQCLEGHFLYLRDPILGADQWHAGSPFALQKMLKLACLAEISGQMEFGFELLAWLAASPAIGEMRASLEEVITLGAETYRRIAKPPAGPA